MPDPQRCPADGCRATYAAAVLDHTGRRCPQCEEPVVACPVCETLVTIGAVWETDECPACQTHRLALGDAVRDAE